MRMPASLRELEATYSDPAPRAERHEVAALKGGAVVLMVGAFEAFLRELFIEQLSRLTGRPRPVAFADLPEKLRVNSTYLALEQAMKGPPYGPSTTRADRLPSVRAACADVVADTIDPEAFSRTLGNPGPVRVKAMFVSVGIDDVFGRLKQPYEARQGHGVAHTYLHDKLKEIVDERHSVAHASSPLSVSRRDLAEWHEFIETLASLLGAELSAYVDDLITGA